MIEHELVRSVLLERLIKANSPEVRFRKEWQDRQDSTIEAPISVLSRDAHPVDRFLNGKEIERAA